MCRYFLIWLGSTGFNTGGTVFFVEVFGWHYLVAKTITAVIVAVGYNFNMQKYFVFRLSA